MKLSYIINYSKINKHNTIDDANVQIERSEGRVLV